MKQARVVRIDVARDFPVHVDGQPWEETGGATISITRRDCVSVLAADPRSSMTSVGSGRGYERDELGSEREKSETRGVFLGWEAWENPEYYDDLESAPHVRAEHAGLMIDNTRATFYLYTVPRTPSLTPPSHQCPSSSSGGMWRARGTRRSAPTRNGARAYRQETHQKTHQKTKLAAIKRFVSPSVADCRLSRGVTKLWERVRKLAARVRSASVGGAPCVRPRARVSAAERSADTGGERRARVHARDGRASDGTRDTRRAFSNASFVRCRASASSFLARRVESRTAGDAPGRVTRGREPGFDRSGLAARGDDTHPSPRARPRLRNRPAFPQPARPNEKNVPRRT